MGQQFPGFREMAGRDVFLPEPALQRKDPGQKASPQERVRGFVQEFVGDFQCLPPALVGEGSRTRVAEEQIEFLQRSQLSCQAGPGRTPAWRRRCAAEFVGQPRSKTRRRSGHRGLHHVGRTAKAANGPGGAIQQLGDQLFPCVLGLLISGKAKGTGGSTSWRPLRLTRSTSSLNSGRPARSCSHAGSDRAKPRHSLEPYLVSPTDGDGADAVFRKQFILILRFD